ncbi:hypothetical protein [Nitrospira sp. Kam-Ns4a]
MKGRLWIAIVAVSALAWWVWPALAQHAHPSAGAVAAESDLVARQYSIFMHRASGGFLVGIGTLGFLSGFRWRWLRGLRTVWPLLWIGLGFFLLVRSDPEAWPIGPVGLWESFSLPTAGEILQHKVLAAGVVLIGIFELLRVNGRLGGEQWRLVMPGLWMVSAVLLLAHRHLDHPTMDLANLQHLSWGLQSLLLATIRLLEEIGFLRWNHGAGLWTLMLAVLGLQLTFYEE